MDTRGVIVFAVIWMVSGAVAIFIQDAGVLGYALLGSLVFYFLK